MKPVVPEAAAVAAEAPVIVAAEAPVIVAAPRSRSWLGDFAMLTKARLTLLVLMTTAAGFCFGSGRAIDWFLLFRVLFGTAFVAAGASVLNQFIERRVDRLMARTRNRPLPAGRMNAGTALGLGVLLSVAGLIYLQNRVSPLCAELAGLTLAVYVALYTPVKRKSPWCVAIGAVSGAIPPLVGWAAAVGSLAPAGWILFGILFFWQIPHFIALAWIYRDEYSQAGFYMLRRRDLAGTKAAGDSLLCAAALTVVTLMPAFLGLVHPIYTVGVIACDAWMLICAALFLVHRDRSSARRLFLASILYLPLALLLLVAARA
jgi:protoheme IX farnesyltransferase